MVKYTVSSRFSRSIGFSMKVASREILKKSIERNPTKDWGYLSSGFAATLSLTMLANFSSRAFNSSTEASMFKSSCILIFMFD